MYLYPEEIDERLNWHPGTARQLARRRKLPHRRLPNGEIRFVWSEVEPLVVRVPAEPAEPAERTEEPAGPLRLAPGTVC
jgi:hypothetical protein